MKKIVKKLFLLQMICILAVTFGKVTEAEAAAKSVRDGVYRAVATDSLGDKFAWEMLVEHHEFDVDWYVEGANKNYKKDAYFGVILYQTDVISGNRHAHAMCEFETCFVVSSDKGKYTSISNDNVYQIDIKYVGKNKLKVKLCTDGGTDIKNVVFKLVKGSSSHPISDWN
uniref:Uncharacterized protein n=1 Tax=Eubacterium plexicaudatum ASF492 TaxID=1235802 RepID=N2B2T0_9FIRM